jgi:hypothetical protein
MKKFLSIVILFLTFIVPTQASHLMGGEITWKCIKSGVDAGKYVFIVKVYRDCQGVPINTNTSLIAHNVPGLAIIPLQYLGAYDISPFCDTINGPNSAYSCNGNNINGAGNGVGAVEEHTYQSLPLRIVGVPDANGWHFTWELCCRNLAVTNLFNNTGQYGFTLRAVMYSYTDSLGNIHPSSDNCYDSSPKFYEKPRTILEANNGYDPLAFSNGFTYSHNAFDDERDSLAYDWAHPLDNGYNYLSPNAMAIPFNTAVYPLSFDNPIDGIMMNSQTGKTWYDANDVGNFVTCTKVTAYKCGQLVSEVYREIQVVISNPICNLGDTTGGNVGADTMCNIRPLVQPPFFFPLLSPQYQWDTIIHCGDTVSFDFIANDYDVYPNGSLQDLQFTVSGGQFMNYDVIPPSLCDNPPCATFNEISSGATPPFITAGGFGAGHFEWFTSCNHTVTTCGNDLRPSLYTFVIKVQDDFCPAPAIENTAQVISILVCPPCNVMKAFPTSTPAICSSNDGTISISPGGGFPPYNAFYFDMSGISVNPDSLISGDYEVRVRDSSLCETIDTITVGQIGATTSSSTTISSCYDYVWNGITYTSSGIYDTIFTNSLGCDSIATLDLTINISTNSIDSIIDCDTYTWNGITYSASGIYDTIFTNSLGCDSIATLDLTINISTNSIDSIIECDTYTWNGITYSASGIYDTIFTNSLGCDSIATLILTISSSSSSLSTVTACDSYSWNGITYSTPASSGIYTFNTTNTAGCDSIATLVLTIFESILSSNLSSASLSCYGSSDGSVNLTPLGVPPYSFLWSNGQTSEDITGLTEGIYSVIITDSTSCTIYDTIIVSAPLQIISSLTSSSSTLTGISSGGSQPFSHTIYDPTDTFFASSINNFGTSFTVSPLVSGQYCMVTIDVNGCSDTVCALFATNFSPVVTVSISNNICDSLTDLSISVSQDSGEVDMSTALFQSNAGSFDISSMNVGDTIGTSVMMAGGGSLNLNSYLIVSSASPPNSAVISSIDTIVGNLGSFTISNQLAGGINIASSSITDGNNYTSGNMSSVFFNNVFINPCVPLIFTSTIDSELGDVQVTTFNYTTTSLDNNVISNDIRIYPNPAKDRFIVDFERNVSDCSVSLFDILGKSLLYQNQFSNISAKEIILDDLTDGSYLIIIKADGVQYNRQIIIQE